MIKIYCYQFGNPLPDEQWRMYCDLLPNEIQQKILRYHRWQDRHAALFGRVLLKLALLEAGYPSSCLESLKLDNYNRPSIDSNIDFNISHSEAYVLCALSENGRIGIDIEYIKDIEMIYYSDFMSNSEWHNIIHDKAPISRFYHYWTLKESVMKADGRGLNIPPKDIISYQDYAVVDNKKWGLKKIPIPHNEYCCHLAFEKYKKFKLPSITHKIRNYSFGGNTLHPVDIFEVLPDTEARTNRFVK
ncbi:4'-phosphopantetheinyl transferase family protein [Methylobacter sp.]|uniref:4'-phosphopantetheinyl transferase family protein n=1 Tax=Methylobacter sp. TaxID=2051955 RepID=UPI002FDDD8A7